MFSDDKDFGNFGRESSGCDVMSSFATTVIREAQSSVLAVMAAGGFLILQIVAASLGDSPGIIFTIAISNLPTYSTYFSYTMQKVSRLVLSSRRDYCFISEQMLSGYEVLEDLTTPSNLRKQLMPLTRRYSHKRAVADPELELVDVCEGLSAYTDRQ
jgi:hypothetical protein